MEQLAWSDGSKPVRSVKEDRSKYSNSDCLETTDQIEFNEVYKLNNMMHETIFREPNGKREDANFKISERQMIGQTYQNPFFNNTTYVNDIDIQENYLIPRSSNDKSNLK